MSAIVNGPEQRADAIEAAIGRLASDGYAVADNLIGAALAGRLLARLAKLQSEGALATAGVGREGGRQVVHAIRQAAIHWLNGEDAAERDLLALAETIRVAINRQLFLGLFHFECHFIAYPVGGFYKRHLDALAGTRNRVVSFVTYLDPDWLPEHGGALRLWNSPEDVEPPALEIVPRAGRVVLMLSEHIPHEVLPAHRPRHAIAGWWRVASG
ncbi:2OG-Fe(II) oxygenase [Kaistia algarum]|uniref:2OG-Fe(II) oxygenase n=1 Tax=Kaistia algarum TaxID=2083279 RepID=UPI0014029033|nr:2OG-Fe(II) oxygenase [Kaistia algarum]MCX5513016.1 2OG-Fe(II) oxygenase [Kaistia algarum]